MTIGSTRKSTRIARKSTLGSTRKKIAFGLVFSCSFFVLWIVFLVLRIVRLVSVKRSPVLLRLVLLPYYSRTTPVLLRYYSSTTPVSTP